MPFTAPVLNIGQGLADGIMTGTDTLNKAISYVGDQYAKSKAAEGVAQWMATQKASNGQPMMTKDELNDFMGKSGSAKLGIIGLKSAMMLHGAETNNQMALQQSGGRVQVSTSQQEAENAIITAKKYGLIPPGQPAPDARPAPQIAQPGGQVTQPSGQPVAPLATVTPDNLQSQGFIQTKEGMWANPKTGVTFDPNTKNFGHLSN